ncbi:winged helix-turn-helix domain-containing protein [Clostridiaceae bacterium Marseille-Q4143]|nr:winged helix-turn-helix domain-containing protein [Clostridiaceae bacterium Marseille-Q4143]
MPGAAFGLPLHSLHLQKIKYFVFLKLIYKNPSIKQKELVAETGKSLSTVKRIMESLQKKEYIRRVDGKRYGK